MDIKRFTHIDMQLSHLIRQTALKLSIKPNMDSKNLTHTDTLPLVSYRRQRLVKGQK